MGFTVKRKVYKLTFADDTDLAGLEVTVRSLDTGQFLELNAARAQREAGGKQGEIGLRRQLEMLAANLVSWNAEDDGQPLPTTLESLLAQDVDFNLTIINAWVEAINGVPAPLPQTSTDGPSSVEASTLTEIPSESLAS